MKTKYFFAIVMMGALISSCGSKQQRPVNDDGSEDSMSEYENRDSTIYGLCTAGSTLNLLKLLTDNGDTLKLNTIPAQENQTVFGGYEPGDRMAVLTNAKKTQAVFVFNQTVLLGDWVTPNPIDGSSEMGITFKDGGSIDGIDQSSIIFKSWRLNNGRLEIVSQRDDGTDFEENNSYKILYLSKDSLVYRDAETIYEYSRPKPEEEVYDIELDDGSADFFM